ncbi:hypothetical protein J1N35_026685 [Gossypium stocksii]|uniref:DUF4283 domain-containing protein n=1 Tax=Gossypium stocksii TaxID=47602 RepID=A0A9D3ZYE6_9ROSI|nr:hypothetical protein J1N35_026685 [Gossypium stocksii]
MENELADLSINEDEEDILQIPFDSITKQEEFLLVGCFLTASLIHFPAMKSTMANLWHPVRGVQIRDLGEKKVFIPILPSYGLAKGFKREDGEARDESKWQGNRGMETGVQNADNVKKAGKRGPTIDPILGFNLEGNTEFLTSTRRKFLRGQLNSTMECDLEEGILMGEEGKKRARGDIEECSSEEGKFHPQNRKYTSPRHREESIGKRNNILLGDRRPESPRACSGGTLNRKTKITFSFIPRTENTRAHDIARRALENGTTFYLVIEDQSRQEPAPEER